MRRWRVALDWLPWDPGPGLSQSRVEVGYNFVRVHDSPEFVMLGLSLGVFRLRIEWSENGFF